MPVGSTDAPGAAPSGDVALSVGVVTTVPTCATALLAANSAGIIAASNETPVDILRPDIGHSSCFLL